MITQRIAGCANIKFMPGFIPDDQIQVYMNASDAVILPYRDILTSGAAILAMSFGRACIAPRLGCINDILDEHGAFLYDPDATDGLVRALKSAVASGRDLSRMGAYNRYLAKQWDWERIAQRTLDVYYGAFGEGHVTAAGAPSRSRRTPRPQGRPGPRGKPRVTESPGV